MNRGWKRNDRRRTGSEMESIKLTEGMAEVRHSTEGYRGRNERIKGDEEVAEEEEEEAGGYCSALRVYGL